MATYGHLSRAPIAEAILDVQVLARNGLDPSLVRNGFSAFIGTFPTQKDWKAMRASFTAGPTGTSHRQEDLGLQGVLMASADEKWIARATVDGLSLSRLEPYSSWEEVLGLFLGLWTDYLACAQPAAAKRAAVRYINRLELPGSFDLARILDIPISIPDAVQADLVGYSSRYVLASQNTEGAANLAIAVEPGPTPQSSTLVFDIDCSSASPEGIGLESMKRVLTALRDLKNRIFFGSFTDEALEGYR